MKNEVQRLAELLIRNLEKVEDEKKKEEMIRVFVQILKEKNKIHLLPRILEEVKRREKETETVLVLARKFDEETLREIKERVKKILGKEVKLKIDEELLGGFLIKNGSLLIDASIKNFLNKIEKILWKFTKF